MQLFFRTCTHFWFNSVLITLLEPFRLTVLIVLPRKSTVDADITEQNVLQPHPIHHNLASRCLEQHVAPSRQQTSDSYFRLNAVKRG